MFGYRTVRVDVGAAEIEAGVRDSRSYNPVALAIRPHASGVVSVWTGQRVGEVWMRHNGVFQIAELPADANAKLVAFDRGERMEPFEFDLEISLIDQWIDQRSHCAS